MLKRFLRPSSALLALTFACSVIACDDDEGTDTDTTAETDTAADTTEDTADTATDATDTTDTAADTTDTTADTTDTTGDTTADTADTALDTSDTALPPQTCVGVLSCVDSQCVGLAGEARTTCLAGCATAADEGVKAAYNELDSCMSTAGCYPATNPPTDKEIQDQADCQRGNCLDETATCLAGTFGAGSCPDLNGCVNSNCIDRKDLACVSTCMQGSTMIFANDWLDYSLCIENSCYDSTMTQLEFEACEQQARNNPQCSLEDTACFGDIGAGPGAGAGGGLPAK
ncbi:MAG: hypothetical protein ACI9MR_000605 [Myxococcota bacterium]|jgi:hypothetical protein